MIEYHVLLSQHLPWVAVLYNFVERKVYGEKAENSFHFSFFVELNIAKLDERVPFVHIFFVVIGC